MAGFWTRIAISRWEIFGRVRVAFCCDDVGLWIILFYARARPRLFSCCIIVSCRIIIAPSDSYSVPIFTILTTVVARLHLIPG